MKAMHRKDDTMNSDNLRIFNALKAIADKLGAGDKSNVSENEVGKIAEELERIAMIEDLKPEPGGGGGGSLSGLSDTAIATPSNNDVLTYDSSSNKWKNAAGGSGGGLVVPTFTLDYDNDTATCDMTATEVINAVKTGTCISAVDDYGEFFYVNQLQIGGMMGDIVRFSNIVSMPESTTSATIEIKNIDITSGGMIAFSYTDPVTIGE